MQREQPAHAATVTAAGTGVVVADASSNATAAAASTTWRCTLHGQLPLSRFTKDDLRRNRHRCKRCMADKMANYRAKFPRRHMWSVFLQHARAEFGRDEVGQLSWKEHGQPLLCRLLGNDSNGTYTGDAACDHGNTKHWSQWYRLAWQPGVELDLQQVHLVKKGSRNL